MRDKREPTVFRELEEVGISYVAFMPAKVELDGVRDATLYPVGGRE